MSFTFNTLNKNSGLYSLSLLGSLDYNLALFIRDLESNYNDNLILKDNLITLRNLLLIKELKKVFNNFIKGKFSFTSYNYIISKY